MKKLCRIIYVQLFIALITFGFAGQHPVSAAPVSFSITANSGSVSPNQGSFAPNSITVNSGDAVTITFSVPGSDPYCCGIQVKGNGGQFDTGTIAKGTSKAVTFTAASSFTFTAYWPSTGTVKATGNVTVQAAQPDPPAVPANLQGHAIGTTQIDLSWSASNGATSYELYRNNSSIATLSNLTYSDNGLSPNTSYTYKIRAIAGSQMSNFTSNVSVQTGSLPTPTPTINPTTSTTISPSPTLTDSENGTATPTTTQSASKTPTPTVTITPTGTPTVTPTVFTDPTYDYVKVNTMVYGFKEIPEIKQGEKFILYGRTIANAKIEIILHSTPLTYTTTSNANGVWTLEVPTKTLEAGAHTFQTIIIIPGSNQRVEQEPVSFTINGSGTNKPTPTVSEGSDATVGGYGLAGGGILLILIAAILWKKGR